MRCITIQSKEVIQHLIKNKEYHVDPSLETYSNLKKPYKFMMKQYHYKYRPIFMCIVGHRANFYGANTIGTFIMELDVPVKFIKLHEYYDWTDFIYFMETREPIEGFKSVESFGKYILNKHNKYESLGDYVYEVTTQFIMKSWIKKVIPMNKKFEYKYVGNGGIEVLHSIE